VLAGLKRRAGELKAQLLTLWFCRSHPDTPLAAKVLAALVLAYAFSPIDLIPDFVPILGYLDDLVLLPLGIYLLLRLIPAHVLAESRRQADLWIAEQKGRPRNWWAAIAIVAVWLAAAYGLWILIASE
jgi:uncharacterized membrane protein YkvA (DUF1232 family)